MSKIKIPLSAEEMSSCEALVRVIRADNSTEVIQTALGFFCSAMSGLKHSDDSLILKAPDGHEVFLPSILMQPSVPSQTAATSELCAVGGLDVEISDTIQKQLMGVAANAGLSSVPDAARYALNVFCIVLFHAQRGWRVFARRGGRRKVISIDKYFRPATGHIAASTLLKTEG